jgi:hypothetical protein
MEVNVYPFDAMMVWMTIIMVLITITLIPTIVHSMSSVMHVITKEVLHHQHVVMVAM